ncbi:MAG: sugar transferase [Candidatus Dormibacteria bacterium]|jgi:exopolysaccharide biosynthesis polyprenyl glycosylphosphotransferase
MIAQKVPGATVAAGRRGILASERKLLLAAGDTLLVAASLIIAFNLRSGPIQHAALTIPWLGVVLVTAIWLASALVVDAYDLHAAVSVRAIFRVVATTVTLETIALLVVFFVAPYGVTRPTILIWVPVAALTVLCWRLLYRRVFAQAIFAGRIVLVADPETIDRVWGEVEEQLAGLYRVVGTIHPADVDAGSRLTLAAAARDADQIVLGAEEDLPTDLFASLVDCYDRGLVVRSIADIYEELTGRLLVERLRQTWLLSLQQRGETSRIYSVFRRIVDIVAGSAGLLFLGILLPFVWIAVKLEDRGPVFHSQERVGHFGKPFEILKLRTMRERSDEELRWTTENDARITKVGAVLRRLHIDELPQAWNILRGDMSVVGPRPEQPQYVEALRESIPYYNTRLSVRPGLTGWAQVNYGYGGDVGGAAIKLSYDLYYIKRQSVALDLLIMARTVFAVATLKGR